MQRRLRIAGPFALGLLVALVAAEAAAYEILLDIDNDGNPATINDFTTQDEAVVRMILRPSVPGEVFPGATFGLGGSCLECQQVHHYGTDHDLLGADWSVDWTEVDELTGWGDGVTLLGCADNPGYHLLLTVEPVDGPLSLDGPMFIATFNVWKAGPVSPGCQQPPANLAAMFELGSDGFWNYVQIGGPASIGTERISWSMLKGNYR